MAFDCDLFIDAVATDDFTLLKLCCLPNRVDIQIC